MKEIALNSLLHISYFVINMGSTSYFEMDDKGNLISIDPSNKGYQPSRIFNTPYNELHSSEGFIQQRENPPEVQHLLRDRQ